MTKPSRKQNAKGAALGQHFLTRPEIAGWVADAIPITQNDTVLEIGPGHGILTRELLKRAGKVVAIEKDATLVAELQITFAADLETGKLVLVVDDIRNFDPSAHDSLLGTRYSLLANIPYYITGLIIRKFLTASCQPSNLALLVQKEVAERIVVKKIKPFDSAEGKESLLSLSVKAYGTPRYVRTVKAGAFSPPPKVDSAILAIEDISRKNFASDEQEELYFSLLHAGFANKRKLLASNLATLMKNVPSKGASSPNEKVPGTFSLTDVKKGRVLSPTHLSVARDDEAEQPSVDGRSSTIYLPTAFTACGIAEKARAEELSVEQWLCLVQH